MPFRTLAYVEYKYSGYGLRLIPGPGKVCFCATKTVLCYKTPCPQPGGVGLLQSRDNNTVEKMKQNKPDGRCDTCPQWDRWHIRIPKLEDQQKIIELYQKSEAKTKSDFVRARLLGEAFKVITKDKPAELYPREFSSILALMHRLTLSL